MYLKRELGEGRSYKVMWNKYSRRVLLAMSSQAFAQLVSKCPPSRDFDLHADSSRTEWYKWYIRCFNPLSRSSLFSFVIVISYYARELPLFTPKVKLNTEAMLCLCSPRV